MGSEKELVFAISFSVKAFAVFGFLKAIAIGLVAVGSFTAVFGDAKPFSGTSVIVTVESVTAFASEAEPEACDVAFGKERAPRNRASFCDVVSFAFAGGAKLFGASAIVGVEEAKVVKELGLVAMPAERLGLS